MGNFNQQASKQTLTTNQAPQLSSSMKRHPINDMFPGRDPRPQLLKDSKQNISLVDLRHEQPGFGEGVPDVSKFPEFLAESKDMPLDTFKDTWAKEAQSKYVEKLSFNPLDAKYFDTFMQTAERSQKSPYKPEDNFSLSEGQLATFKRNGFVVTKPEDHWGKAYYRIYNNDLPVLVTADSILHAFHKSYDSMLKDLEIQYLAPALMKIFTGTRSGIKEAAFKFVKGPLAQSFKDLDFYLTVGINLLNAEEYYRPGSENEPKTKKPKTSKKNFFLFEKPKEETLKEQISTVLGEGEDLVDAALKACREEQRLEVVFFGKKRVVDFSLLKPRGHYTKSASLREYFRAFTWLAKIDLIVAGQNSNVQQTGSAVVTHMLLTMDKELENTYNQFNKIIEALVGPANSMDAKQLGVLLDQVFKLKNFESLNSEEALTNLQEEIIKTDLGKKKYNDGDWRSFTFIGQKFSIDSWAQSKVITNTTEEDNPDTRPNVIFWQGEEVHRHSTSAVEIAFSVLANNDAVPTIHQRISDTSGANKFRDGLMYHTYLDAARKTVDSLPKEAWTTSIYTYWLLALRKLSITLDARFPEAMQTQAFAMKKMETQLGSWAQARHDNILYIEQLARFIKMCEYPDAFVEPYVEFWDAMEKLCMAIVEVWSKVGRGGDLRNIHQKSVQFFQHFAQCARILREISTYELAQKQLTQEQTVFLKTIVELEVIGSGGETKWTGWYPALFYGGEDDLEDSDLIVADTYTNPPSPIPVPDPGCVVHQGLGYPRRMLMAVNNGPNLCCYAGPVYSYHEFELTGIERWSDEQWAEKVKKGAAPPSPEWTSSYLVPN